MASVPSEEKQLLFFREQEETNSAHYLASLSAESGRRGGHSGGHVGDSGDVLGTCRGVTRLFQNWKIIGISRLEPPLTIGIISLYVYKRACGPVGIGEMIPDLGAMISMGHAAPYCWDSLRIDALYICETLCRG